MGAALFVTDGCRPLRFSSVDGDAMMENAADVVALSRCARNITYLANYSGNMTPFEKRGAWLATSPKLDNGRRSIRAIAVRYYVHLIQQQQQLTDQKSIHN
eukprot:scaffold693_cov200-Alexandrium_tamarense.AAC.10